MSSHDFVVTMQKTEIVKERTTFSLSIKFMKRVSYQSFASNSSTSRMIWQDLGNRHNDH